MSCAEGAYLASRTSCSPRCAVGFEPSVALLECVDGAIDQFECNRQCHSPLAVANAFFLSSCAEGSWIQDGGNCTTSCSWGYEPSVPILVCGSAKLSPVTFKCDRVDLAVCALPLEEGEEIDPICLPPCMAPEMGNMPGAAKGGACEEGSLIQSGHVCSAQCADGYTADVVHSSASSFRIQFTVAKKPPISLSRFLFLAFYPLCRLSLLLPRLS